MAWDATQCQAYPGNHSYQKNRKTELEGSEQQKEEEKFQE